MATNVTNDIKVRPKPGLGGGSTGSGGGPFDPRSGDPGSWPPGLTREDAIEPRKYQIGMWVGLGSILMLFAALTSALIVRQNAALSGKDDWVPIAIPPVMWLNSVLLLISSGTLETARRALARDSYGRFRVWITITTALGVAFLAGQLIAWRDLAAEGVYINSHPHSSFFYLLTSLHGVHLLGGLIALLYVTFAALRMRITAKKRLAVGVTSIYWHFMDGLWVYLFVLLFFWK